MYEILQKQEKININDKVNIDSWKNDERSAITYYDLLHMNSGLECDDNYNTISDVTKMLFLATEMGWFKWKNRQLENLTKAGIIHQGHQIY